jgi:PIN domain nuclease of toxin-antitoxin system
MRALLDTHVFLWWITQDQRLSSTAVEIIRDADNQLLLSAASSWEIVLKAQLGKLQLTAPPAELLPRHMDINQIKKLPITFEHTLQLFALPLHHRDPFDRILVAQAQAENLPLLTADPLVAQYPIQVIW